MKSVLIIFVLFLITSSCYFLSCVQQKDYLERVTQIPDHPRILLFPDKERRIKEVIRGDSTWNAVHQIIIEESDRILKKSPLKYDLKGIRLLEVARECRKRIYFLSYSWRLTGDKKYLKRAEQEMLIVSGFKDWNPQHFLDVAEITMGISIGYDWLYNDLQKSSLEIIQKAIIKKGIEPSLEREFNGWLTESSNWNQVCNAAITFGALAIYEDDPKLARRVINRSIESIQKPMKEYEPDGAFPEGYMYWGYGTTFNVYLIDVLEKVFGTDFELLENSGFKKTGGYLTNMVGPSALNFNYSDGYSKSQVNPAMFWFADKLDTPSLLTSEKLLLKVRGDLPWQMDLPAVMIWGSEIKISTIPKPDKLIWVGQGKNPVALMRNSWGPDAIYVGFKGGSPNNFHGHMDVGSFVLDALGERWAMDFETHDYHLVESKGINLWSFKQNSDRWKVFRYNNLAHNTLTFNGEFQLVDGYAPISSFTSGEDFISATSDLTSCYNQTVSEAQRGVGIIDGRYVVVRDEVALSNVASTMRWTMLTPAQVSIKTKNSALLTKNGKSLLVKVVEPEDAEIVTWSTEPPHDYDKPNPGTTLMGFEFKRPAHDKISITVLLIPTNDTDIRNQVFKPLKDWK